MNMVRRIQDKNPRRTCILLLIWSTKIYHLPRYLGRPRLHMHRFVFRRKNKHLRASQRHTKLQRHSPILRITFLCKNGDGIALKALEGKKKEKKKKKQHHEHKSGATREKKIASLKQKICETNLMSVEGWR